MSKYINFRNRTDAENAANVKSRTSFIEESNSSTEVFHVEATDNKKVVITTTHREGLDEIVLFSYANEASPIELGHYVERDSKSYLVFMEYEHPSKEFYKKYKLIQCSGKMGYNDSKIPAAYFSSLRRFMSLTGTDSNNSLNFSEETENPVIIVSHRSEFKKDFRFMFMDDVYEILTVDHKSNPGIAYLSISQTPYLKDVDNKEDGSTKEIPDAAETHSNYNTLYQGQAISFDTHAGYAEFNYDVEVIQRKRYNVEIIVPYGIEELEVVTKNAEMQLITNIFKVVV